MISLAKTFTSIFINVLSSIVEITVRIDSLIDMRILVLMFTIITAITLVLTVYSHKVKSFFPYLLIAKSVIDAMYILTFAQGCLEIGLIILNSVFVMFLIYYYSINSLIEGNYFSKLKFMLFAVCLLVPFLVVFLSIVVTVIAILFYKISTLNLLLLLFVNICILFKASFAFIDLLLLRKTKMNNSITIYKL